MTSSLVWLWLWMALVATNLAMNLNHPPDTGLSAVSANPTTYDILIAHLNLAAAHTECQARPFSMHFPPPMEHHACAGPMPPRRYMSDCTDASRVTHITCVQLYEAMEMVSRQL